MAGAMAQVSEEHYCGKLKQRQNKTMNKHFYWSALLSLALLASCGKAEEPRPSVTPDKEDQTGTFELNLTAGVSDQAVRALTFSGVEDLSEAPKISNTSDFTTHAFFRKKGSNEVGYATITWKARVEAGRIKLILPKTNITLQNITDQTIDANEEWYVAGIAGGGKLSANKTAVTFDSQAIGGSQLQAPIAFPWTRIYKNKMINVTFNPKGVIVRGVVANRIGKDIKNLDLNLETRELSNRGAFDFSHTTNPMESIERGGHEPVWHFTERGFGEAVSDVIPFKVSNLGKEQKQVVLLWAMSREVGGKPGMSIKPKTVKMVEVLRAGRVYPFVSDLAMTNTQVYSFEVDIDVVSPALFVVPNNVNQAGNGFANNDLTESGYFNWKNAQLLMTKKIPAFANLHIPISNEMETLFPHHKAGAEAHLGNPKWKEQVSVLRNDEWTKWGHLMFSGLGNFKCMGNGVVYALRFQKGSKTADPVRFPSLKDNHRRTAFRYTRVASSTSGHIVVDMIRIGEDPTVPNVDAITNSTWWDKARETGRLYQVIIPLAGDKEKGKPAKLQRNVAHYWTSTVSYRQIGDPNPTLANRFLSNETDFHSGLADANLELTVRLFKDMDI